jgi:L-threonine kinase
MLAEIVLPHCTTPQQTRLALPGTCGELVQGTLDGLPCLVSCPIDRYNWAEISPRQGPGWLTPPDNPKAASALWAGLNRLGQAASGGLLSLQSDLPRGRGYASSSADIGATLFALFRAFSTPITAAEVAQLAVAIEPSDSTFFEGLVLFAHRCGNFHRYLGPVPALNILVIDPGGAVDTLAFNRLNHRPTLARLALQHQSMFKLLEEGLQHQDNLAIGAAASLSARLHQEILFNPLLDLTFQLAAELKAPGVCRAHSGTLLGILLDPAGSDVSAAAAYITRRLPPGVSLRVQKLTGGGVRLNPSPAFSPTPTGTLR